MRLRIAIDIDEVLADTLAKHLAIYNLEHGDSLTKHDLEERKSMTLCALIGASACEIIRAPKVSSETSQSCQAATRCSLFLLER
jgi:5'(3')-deoxyribonucleotidase